MKEFLNFRYEYFTTPLFITLVYLSITMIGFNDLKSWIFNIVAILEVPLCFIGTRYTRRLLYNVFYGDVEYED